VNFPLFAGFQKHLRWLFGISAINNRDQDPLNGFLQILYKWVVSYPNYVYLTHKHDPGEGQIQWMDGWHVGFFLGMRFG